MRERGAGLAQHICGTHPNGAKRDPRGRRLSIQLRARNRSKSCSAPHFGATVVVCSKSIPTIIFMVTCNLTILFRV
jgi:hypothetical protein